MNYCLLSQYLKITRKSLILQQKWKLQFCWFCETFLEIFKHCVYIDMNLKYNLENKQKCNNRFSCFNTTIKAKQTWRCIFVTHKTPESFFFQHRQTRSPWVCRWRMPIFFQSLLCSSIFSGHLFVLVSMHFSRPPEAQKPNNDEIITSTLLNSG